MFGVRLFRIVLVGFGFFLLCDGGEVEFSFVKEWGRLVVKVDVSLFGSCGIIWLLGDLDSGFGFLR